jgi:hypothetical protein
MIAAMPKLADACRRRRSRCGLGRAARDRNERVFADESPLVVIASIDT